MAIGAKLSVGHGQSSSECGGRPKLRAPGTTARSNRPRRVDQNPRLGPDDQLHSAALPTKDSQ